MRAHRTLAAGAALAAAALSVGAVTASATTAPVKPKPKFVISALTIVGHPTKAGPSYTYNVTKAPATLKFRVKVKDFDKKFDPKTVTVAIQDKLSATVVQTFTVKTTLVSKSGVVSNWHGALTVPKGAPAGQYCLVVVKVDPNSTAASPVRASAKGLAGRDCFTIIDTKPNPV